MIWKILPLLIAIASICPVLSAHGGPAAACDLDVLRPGGRSYIGLVRAGLKRGDLDLSHLDEIVARERPYNPVTGNKLTTNHSLRHGFDRALKYLREEEWPAVVSEVGRSRQQSALENNLVAQASRKTKNYFYYRPTGIQLERDARDPVTFVSSKGDVYIVTSESSRYILWNFLENVKTPLPSDLVWSPQFFESSRGQVFLLFLRKEREKIVISVFDVKSPSRPYFEFDQRQIRDPRFEDHLLYDLLPLEINGHVQLIYYYSYWDVRPNSGSKPVVTIDLLSEAHSVVHMPNVNSGMGVGSDGRLYFAGGWVDDNAKRGHIFLRDVLADREVFSHRYGENDTYNVPRLRLRPFSDASGSPLIYLGHGGTYSHGRIDRHSKVQVRPQPEVSDDPETFFDRYGRENLAFMAQGRTQGGFFVGEHERFKRYFFPGGQNPFGTDLKVVNGTFGELILFSEIEDSNRRPLIAFHLFLREREEFIRIDVPSQFARFRLYRKSPFYDVKNNRILGWMKTDNGPWMLMQFFGP